MPFWKANLLLFAAMTTLRGGLLVGTDASLPGDVVVARGDGDIDCAGKWVLPGLIDCHVHFREPGYEHKATMQTEAAAALAGGVQTVCEMPNTEPPTVTIAALADKVRRAAGIGALDMRFYFGVTKEEHLRSLVELWTSGVAELQRLKERCCGVKLYFDHSTGNQKIAAALLNDVFAASGTHNIPMVAHCEDPATNAAAFAQLPNQDVASHSLARPPESEAIAVKKAIALAKKHKAHLHIAHLSTKEGLELVRAAKKKKLTVTCEVAPHHLFLTTDDYATLGTLAKMNPPLRPSEHRDALWAGVIDGTVDCIATDHAPHLLEEKQTGAPLSAPSGVPGVETMLPLLLSVARGHWPHPSGAAPAVLAVDQAAQCSALTPQHIVRCCFAAPNRLFSLGKSLPQDGGEPIVVDPAHIWTIHGKDLHSLCKWTPFEGWRVHGKVETHV